MPKVSVDSALGQYRFGLRQLQAWREGRALRRVRRNLEAIKAEEERRHAEAPEIIEWAKSNREWIASQNANIAKDYTGGAK